MLTSSTNLTNACLIKSLNMVATLITCIDQLKGELSAELDQISENLISDMNENGGQIMDVDQLDSHTGLPEEEKYFSAIGFGSALFRTTLQRLVDDSQ